MRTRRTKEQIRKDAYNKDVDAYNYYVVNLETMRAETGFEYREDAVEVLNDYDDNKKYKVVSKRALKSMGVENPNESFKYEDGGKFQSMTREEFMKKEIESQKEKEINKVFKKFRVVVYEQKKSGGYPFTDFETDNFIEGVDFAKKMIQQQKNYRPDSEYLWVTMSKFTPIEERGNVRYPYYEIARFGEEDLETSKYEFGGDFQAGVYAKGGSLESHGIEVGDTFLRTVSGTIQKVKDKNGKIVYINLSTGERDSQPPLPFADGGGVGIEEDIDMSDDKVLRVRKPSMPEKKLTEQEWAEKHNAGAYEYMGKRSYKTGGSLIGNQKRIDMNKNGKIDAEDFKLLRSSMNGAWRNDHEHVNSSNPKQDYEVRYARKNKSDRTGYKGKTKFADGGGVGMTKSIGLLYNKTRRASNDSEEVVYLNSENINLDGYTNLKPYSVKASDEEIKIGFYVPNQQTMVYFSNETTKKNVDRTSFEKYNGSIYITEPLTEKIATDILKKIKFFEKYIDGGSLPSGSINALGDLWFAVQQKDTDDYKMLSNNLDKLKVPFVIQNEVSADAETQRGRKALNIPEVHDRIKKIVEKNSRKFATGGRVSKFQMLSNKVARNYEGKRVKPAYQKEYGKVYSKSEAKEVGNKVAGKVKANQKMATGGAIERKYNSMSKDDKEELMREKIGIGRTPFSEYEKYSQLSSYHKELVDKHLSSKKIATGGENKKGAKGGIMVLAKQIRKDGESWQDALKRAGQQLK